MTLRALAAGMSLTVATSGVAQAQDRAPGPATITVMPSGCGENGWAVSGWVEILRAELAADEAKVERALPVASDGTGAGRDGTTDPAAREIEIGVEPLRCDMAADAATITLVSGSVRRLQTVNLADVDRPARARVLAIAVAGFVRLSLKALDQTRSSERGRDGQFPVPVLPTPCPIEVSASHRLSPPATSAFPMLMGVVASGESKVFVLHNALFGARIGADFGREGWRIRTDAGILSGSAHDVLGDVSEAVATVGVAVLATVVASRFTLGIGPRFDAGAVWFQAASTNPRVVSSSARSPIAMLALSATADFAIARPVSAIVELDLGTDLYGFAALAESTAGERHVADFAGPFVGARLGVAWDARANR